MLLRFILFPVVKNFPKVFPYFFKDLVSDFPHYKNMHIEISVAAFGRNLKLWSANDGLDCTFYPANYFTRRYAVNAKSKIIPLRA
jgi:hypothetical protein